MGACHPRRQPSYIVIYRLLRFSLCGSFVCFTCEGEWFGEGDGRFSSLRLASSLLLKIFFFFDSLIRVWFFEFLCPIFVKFGACLATFSPAFVTLAQTWEVSEAMASSGGLCRQTWVEPGAMTSSGGLCLLLQARDEDELLDFFFSKSVTIKFQGDNCNCISSLQQ